MNVGELIRELQAMPAHAPVQVLLSSVIVIGNHEPYEETLSDEDALDAGEVRYMGNFVLIRSK